MCHKIWNIDLLSYIYLFRYQTLKSDIKVGSYNYTQPYAMAEKKTLLGFLFGHQTPIMSCFCV